MAPLLPRDTDAFYAQRGSSSSGGTARGGLPIDARGFGVSRRPRNEAASPRLPGCNLQRDHREPTFPISGLPCQPSESWCVSHAVRFDPTKSLGCAARAAVVIVTARSRVARKPRRERQKRMGRMNVSDRGARAGPCEVDEGARDGQMRTPVVVDVQIIAG